MIASNIGTIHICQFTITLFGTSGFAFVSNVFEFEEGWADYLNGIAGVLRPHDS